MGLYLGGALLWLVMGTGVALFGRIRGQEDCWTLLGVVAWPVALARMLGETHVVQTPEYAAATGPSDSRALTVARMRCPSCDAMIRADSQSCPYCLHRLETAPVESIDWPPWPDPNARPLAQNIVVPLAFEYVSGEERTRRRILVTLLFEWAEALYLRGHESARSGTRSYSLARMKNVIDERTGERLEGIAAIRDALLRRSVRRAAEAAEEPQRAEPPPKPAASRVASQVAEPMPEPPARAEPPLRRTTVERAAALGGGDMPRAQDHASEPVVTAAPAPRPGPSVIAEPELPLAGGFAAVPDPEMPERRPAAPCDTETGGPLPFADIEDSLPLPETDIPDPPGLAPLPSHLSLTRTDHWTPAVTRLRAVAPPPRPALAFAFARGVVVAGAVAAGVIAFIADNRSGIAPPAAKTQDAANAVKPSKEATQAGSDIAQTRRDLLELVATLRAAAASVKPAAMTAVKPAAVATVAPVEPAAAAPSIPPARPVDWATPLTEDEIRELQTMLTRLGYRPGRVDGIIGSRTAAALEAWQRDRQIALSRHPPRVLLGIMRDELAGRSVLRPDTRRTTMATDQPYRYD